MITTIELRWFYRNTIPAEIENWFQQDCPGEEMGTPEKREDIYLHSECEFLGIKLRQGKLEIKWRKAELGTLRFADRLEGRAEKWSKWICEDPTEESFAPTVVMQKRLWLSIEKVRSQRYYEGCSVELTQLKVKGNAWWSLAFEALDERISTIDDFQAVASKVLKTYPNSQLQVEDSFAYPRWLYLVFS